MKLLEKNLKKGYVKVIPESFDDLWHLYNVIYKNDQIYAYTSREIRTTEEYSRPKRGERVRVFLGVKVETVAWNRLLGKLRIHGTICVAPEIIPVGAHHTVSIAVNTPITISKKEWPKHNIERLVAASKTSENPLLIISIDDEGYAIAETAQYGIDIKVEVRIALPGKLEAEKRSAAKKKYFRKALKSLHQFWITTHRPIVIIGVDFVKKDFTKFLEKESADIFKSVIDVKSVNNGGVAGIYEALRSGILSKATKELRIVEETVIIGEIMERLGKGKMTITYGLEEVEKVANIGAVEKLVLADKILRESINEKRLYMEKVMKEVEKRKGRIIIISTEHEAGQKLLSLGGVAAILRFPIYQNYDLLKS